jgi:hypothetical protein
VGGVDGSQLVVIVNADAIDIAESGGRIEWGVDFVDGREDISQSAISNISILMKII